LQAQYEAMKGTAEMRGLEKTGTAYNDVIKWNDPTDKYTAPKYGYDSSSNSSVQISEGYWTSTPGYYSTVKEPYEYQYTEGVETGQLLYGGGEEEQSFNEFYQSQFGEASGIEDPYSTVGGDVSNQPESEEDKRARISASGAVME